MPFMDQIQTDQRARVSLAPGSYSGLKIVSYIDKASKPDKNGAMQHSFLVAATKPSREQVAAAKGTNGSNPLDTPDFEGTAFFKLTINQKWLNWESVALAYNEVGKDKDGNIKTDYVAKAIADGDCTEESVANARAFYMNVAGEKVLAANTPEDQKDAAILEQYSKELTQISIKIGTLMRLIDWKVGKLQSSERNGFITFDVKTLVGTEFAGKVKEGRPGQDGSVTSEVDSVYSMK